MQTALPFHVLLWVAVRNIGRNKGRSALSLAAIVSGVAGLILSGGFVQDLTFQLGEALIHSQSGHLQVAKAGYFEVGSRSPGKYLLATEDIERALTRDMKHVTETMQRIAFSGLLSNARSSYPILGEGIEPEQEARLGTYMVLLEGRALSATDRYGALVGAGLARAMGLRLGDAFSVVAPTIEESMNTVELEVVGVFQSFSKDYDDRVVKLPLAAAQELLDTKGANVVVMLLDETRHTEDVSKTLGQRIRALGLELRTWEQLNDFYGKTVALYDRQFGVLRLIVLLMVMLAVTGAINIGVLERAGEFGTMRALGNRSGDVIRLVLIEGAAMGTVGALVGVVLGCAAGWILSEVGIPMPPPPNSNLEYVARIRLSFGAVAGAAAIGVAATVIASVFPGIRVARLPIAEALRRLV